MARPDGRIEKGQRLSSAISARAWNRAQEAADRVLGVTPGVEVTSAPVTRDSVVIRISQNYPTLDHTPLAVGQGISIPLNRSTNTRLLPLSKNLQGNSQSRTVSSEDDLPQFSAVEPTALTIESNDTDVSLGSRCGVIEFVSALVDGYYTCTVRVRGLVRCRVLLLQAGASVSPPPPYPTNATLRTYWRRYLMASEYGYGAILGLGARYRMNGTNAYPAIAEAVVNLG
jgi:hypothetical protein